MILASCLFLLAAGVRLLHWQNDRLVIDTIMSGLTARYQEEAKPLIDGDLRAFIRGTSQEADTGILMHPPGYSLLIAIVHQIGSSRNVLRIFHLVCGALAAPLVLFLAIKLLPRGAAVLAAFFVAISPQLSFYSLVLLPDALTLIPVLLAIYLLVIARRNSQTLLVIAAGAAVGISCWLRPNLLLLAPVLGVLVFFLFDRRVRLRYASLIVITAMLVISPIVIRNAVVFKAFVPLSLGTGNILLTGIVDYDPERRFGFENADDAVSRQEAVWYQRPDYAQDLCRPDGIERDRIRLGRAIALIRANKLFFAGITVRRAARILEYEKVPIISVEPSVTNSVEATELSTWHATPPELAQINTSPAGNTDLQLDENEAFIRITNQHPQPIKFESPPISVQPASDYLLKVPARTGFGQTVIKVVRPDNRKTLASAYLPESLKPSRTNDGERFARLKFVNDNATQVKIIVSNTEVGDSRTVVRLGSFELYRLGPANYLWTRYVRTPLKRLQKFFTTGWMVPLAVLGVVLLALAHRWQELLFILVVPAYFLLTNSPIHLELRYVLPLHCFCGNAGGLFALFHFDQRLAFLSQPLREGGGP